jgi:DNA-binding NarL/FixJ family response regulator
VRVLIAEDETLLREGLVRLITDEGHEVVATASDGPELVRRARDHAPDLVITDIRMPPTHTDEGLRGALEIRARRPETAIVVLSQHVDEEGALELLAGGAERVGYLLKQRVMDVDAFMDALDRVAAGGSAIDPEVVAVMVGRRRRDDPVDHLTPRQREVLSLMAEGMSNAAIAGRLFVTEKAVARHIAAIFGTLRLPPAPEDHRRVKAVLMYLGRDEGAGR